MFSGSFLTPKQSRVLSLPKGTYRALTSASQRSYGPTAVEIVRTGARHTQMFGDIMANFRPKIRSHQTHKGRNNSTVHL